MEKLVIKLKQHTPLIHFQHDQEGATLRASEVKPKLDRFILSKLGEEHYDTISDDEYEEVASLFEKKSGKLFDDISRTSQEYEVGKYVASKKCWFSGDASHLSLNYKMKIFIENNSKRKEYLIASYLSSRDRERLENEGIIPINNSPYFAQEKENGEIIRSNNPTLKWNDIPKKGIIESGYIIIELYCFNKTIQKELISFIAESIQAFFLSTNFGTRQSKGFGSLTVNEIIKNNVRLEKKDDEELLKNLFSFVYKRNSHNSDLRIIFKGISEDYRLIKSGVNFPQRGIYNKSKLMEYARSNGIRWEKRFIKKCFNEKTDNNYILRSEHEAANLPQRGEDYEYIRVVLGLAEQFEFILSNPPQGNSKMVVKISNPTIERYQSPLLFKVINNNIYLVGTNVNPDILGKSFDFLMSIQNDNLWREHVTINTPKVFNLKSFIHFAMKDDKLNYIKLK